MEKVKNLVKDGFKEIQIKSQAGTFTFQRQVLSQKKGKTDKISRKKKKKILPIDLFLGERRSGTSVVSKNLKRQAVEECLKSSYRVSEERMGKKLSDETIRRIALDKGDEAKKLEKTTCEEKRDEREGSWQIKDANQSEDSYRKSKEGILRRIMGAILERSALYLMVDGVGVEQQGRVEESKGKRECKVAVVLKQRGEEVHRLATLATWDRISGFRRVLEWVMLGLYGLCSQIVIISDGAKWIRHSRNKIPLLKKAIWILDWFHLKDNVLKLFRMFGFEEESEAVKTTLNWLWYGNTQKALEMINKLPFAKEEQEKEKQEMALQKLKTYLKNQKEGIVNYQTYKMKGYIVGSGCVEKMNDQLIKSRMVRQRRIRWSLKGGEAMMQLLTAKMNGRLDELFT